MIPSKVSRRQFLGTSAGAALAVMYVPRTVWGANERVNVGVHWHRREGGQ